jgi:hypothetical protein
VFKGGTGCLQVEIIIQNSKAQVALETLPVLYFIVQVI